MMIGDIVEAVFKGLLTQAGISYSDGERVTLTVGEHEIPGTPDLIMDGKVDDVKSASPWSYENKFKSFQTLDESDSFGYVAQLAGYAKACGVKAGGWWVVNKATGEFKYVAAEGIDVDKELSEIQATADHVKKNEFERCYEAVEETYRKKPTGNLVLGRDCQWCSYRYACWPGLEERPSLVSRAENKPMVSYVSIKKTEVED
jgi:CRISPR/Cas system-associated exonuclease Cas4 (RecB family)